MTTATNEELGIQVGIEPSLIGNEANQSSVSWAAVIGGAFIAASFSLTLLALGSGLGLSSVSPWSNAGASASALGTASIVWLIAMQIISSSMGGYLAGRLRTKWVSVHSDEVHFRDTVHGLLVWSVGIVITAAFLTSAAATMVGTTNSTSSPMNMAGSASPEPKASDPIAYYVDSLFRSELKTPYDAPAQLEAGRIFSTALSQKEMSAPDQTYLAQMIANRTALSREDASKRLAVALNDARESMEAVRKAATHLLLWLFIALLIGAFSASLAATLGGQQRDHAKTK